MTRSTAVAALCLALVATACDAPGHLPLAPGTMGTPASTVLAGVIIMTTDSTPRLGLIQENNVLTYLGGKTDELQAHLNEAVKVVGDFDTAGVFMVAAVITGDTDKQGGTDQNRRP